MKNENLMTVAVAKLSHSPAIRVVSSRAARRRIRTLVGPAPMMSSPSRRNFLKRVAAQRGWR
ncbi:hypothetical protein, partial [Xanthomonas fragariae]|uniref:hypothetical protein n=1 Tax=Xanthomonas fragariae TaxID=48664 RepID=UPI001F44A3E8